MLLNHATELVPGEQEFGFMKAQLYLRKMDYKSAREILEPIAQSSATPAELRQRSKSMLDMIVTMEQTNAAAGHRLDG